MGNHVRPFNTHRQHRVGAVLLNLRRNKMQIGILGAGHVGLAVGRRLIGAGHRVKLSSARGPQALTPVAQGIGAEAASVTEAAAQNSCCLRCPGPQYRTRSTRSPIGRVESSSTLRTHSSPSIRCSSLILRAEAQASSSPSMHLVRGWSRRSTRSPWRTSKRGLDRARRDGCCSSPVTTSHPSRRSNSLITELGYAPIDLGGLDDGGRMQQPGGPLAGPDLLVNQ